MPSIEDIEKVTSFSSEAFPSCKLKEVNTLVVTSVRFTTIPAASASALSLVPMLSCAKGRFKLTFSEIAPVIVTVFCAQKASYFSWLAITSDLRVNWRFSQSILNIASPLSAVSAQKITLYSLFFASARFTVATRSVNVTVSLSPMSETSRGPASEPF